MQETRVLRVPGQRPGSGSVGALTSCDSPATAVPSQPSSPPRPSQAGFAVLLLSWRAGGSHSDTVCFDFPILHPRRGPLLFSAWGPGPGWARSALHLALMARLNSTGDFKRAVPSVQHELLLYCTHRLPPAWFPGLCSLPSVTA